MHRIQTSLIRKMPPQTRHRTAEAAQTSGASRNRSRGGGARGTRGKAGLRADGPIRPARSRRSPAVTEGLRHMQNKMDELRRLIASLTAKVRTVQPSRKETRL